MSLFDDREPEDQAEDEAPAPAQAEEGLPEPRRASLCLGHARVEADLLERLNSGRFPHGLIFSGRAGIGKATMAFRFARFLLRDSAHEAAGLFGDPGRPRDLSVPESDPAFARVASGGHPDLLTVERQGDEKTGSLRAALDVDQVRRIAPFLRMTASGGGWRVVIVDDADTMNRNAQNALLKILEEPPPRSLLILVAHRIGRLLPTIRSRTQTVPFQPLATDIVLRLLRQGQPEGTEADHALLADLAEGSIGDALRMAQEGGGALVRQICAPLDDEGLSAGLAVHGLAGRISTREQDGAWRLFVSLLPQLVHRAALGRTAGAMAELGLERWAGSRSRKELLEIYGRLQHTLDRAGAANLDRATAVLCAFGILKGLEGIRHGYD